MVIAPPTFNLNGQNHFEIVSLLLSPFCPIVSGLFKHNLLQQKFFVVRLELAEVPCQEDTAWPGKGNLSKHDESRAGPLFLIPPLVASHPPLHLNPEPLKTALPQSTSLRPHPLRSALLLNPLTYFASVHNRSTLLYLHEA